MLLRSPLQSYLIKNYFPFTVLCEMKAVVNQSCELEQKKIKACGNKSRHLGGGWGAH